MADETRTDAMTALNAALATGFETGDFKGLADLSAEDAVVLPARGRPIKGRDAIATFWTGVRNRFTGMTFTTGEFKPLGEGFARETGTYVMTTEGGREGAAGKYLVVWQNANGSWVVESIIWARNADQGQRGQRQGGGTGQGGGAQGRGQAGGQGGGPGGGYRQGGGQGRQQGGYGGGRRGGIGSGPRGGVGGGGAGIGGGGGGIGGGRQGNPQGGRRGQGGGQGRQQGGGQNLYDQSFGLYSNLDE